MNWECIGMKSIYYRLDGLQYNYILFISQKIYHSIAPLLGLLNQRKNYKILSSQFLNIFCWSTEVWQFLLFISKKLPKYYGKCFVVSVNIRFVSQGWWCFNIRTLLAGHQNWTSFPWQQHLKQNLIEIKFIIGNLLPDPTTIIISACPNEWWSCKFKFKIVKWRRQLHILVVERFGFSLSSTRSEVFLRLCCSAGFMFRCCKLSRLSVFGSWQWEWRADEDDVLTILTLFLTSSHGHELSLVRK